METLGRIDVKNDVRDGTFWPANPLLLVEDAMKSYFTNLPTRTWVLLVLPAVMLAYPVVRIVVPAVLHAVVPEVVRSVLSMI
jgi:hypothetical protein